MIDADHRNSLDTDDLGRTLEFKSESNCIHYTRICH